MEKAILRGSDETAEVFELWCQNMSDMLGERPSCIANMLQLR
jgi:hypothetical protein